MDPQQPVIQPVPPKQILTMPIAILLAAVLIAGAILWNKPSKMVPTGQTPDSEGVLSPVTAKDHILGNPDAKIMIVEYSDASCPFCKMFHPTMKKVMDTYGKTGNVAWVYRHFPLDKPDGAGRVLHKNAGTEAQAMECAADLGGNDKFWAFTHRLYEITPAVTSKTPEGFDPKGLPVIAEYIGLDKAKFEECLASGRYKDKVESQYLSGINAGVAGTPFSFIVAPNGDKIPVNGAQSYDSIKAAIDAILASE